MDLRTKKDQRYIKNTIIIALAILKSFFNSVTNTAWGVAGIFIFNLAFSVLLKEQQITYVSTLFIKFEYFIIINIIKFLVVLFCLSLYDNLRFKF